MTALPAILLSTTPSLSKLALKSDWNLRENAGTIQRMADPRNRVTSGAVYQYLDVPATVFEELTHSESNGRNRRNSFCWFHGRLLLPRGRRRRSLSVGPAREAIEIKVSFPRLEQVAIPGFESLVGSPKTLAGKIASRKS